MGRDTFLLVFVLGSAALAVWTVVCHPALAPRKLWSAAVHLFVALLIGTLLAPALNAVPGLPSQVSVLIALFVLALPAITYMLVVGLWLVELAVREAPPARR